MPNMDEMTKALQAEDERQAKLHELLETIREQIRLEVLPEHRPEGLFENIQNAVYAMRGRTPLMNDAVITSRLAAQPAAPVGEPDAWQYRCKKPDADKWSNWRPCEDPHDVEDIARHGKLAGYDAEARPLYAAPPPCTQKVREALELAEDVLSRRPFSTDIWPNGMHPQTGIEIIRKALAALSTNPGEQE